MSHGIKIHKMFDEGNGLHPMNEKVQNLANSVYKEFEIIIKKHGAESLESLMPVVVNILECLDHNLKEKQKIETDLELFKVEINHFKSKCEKETNLRKSADSKYLEIEDLLEESKKQIKLQQNDFELSSKRLEIKIKNLQDHVTRLEEKDHKSRDDFSKLHIKYSDLLKTHTDFVKKSSHSSAKNYQEAKKSRLPKDIPQKIEKSPTPSSSSSPQIQISQEISRPSHKSNYYSLIDSSTFPSDEEDKEILKDVEENKKKSVNEKEKEPSKEIVLQEKMKEEGGKFQVSLEGEVGGEDRISSGKEKMSGEKKKDEEKIKIKTSAETSEVPELQKEENFILEVEEDYLEITEGKETEDAENLIEREEEKPKEENSEQNNMSIYEEISILDDNSDLTSMVTEVDKLIQENTELLATKNALNILKDDLIADVEDLSGELEVLKKELTSLKENKEDQEKKIKILEDDLKKVNEELTVFKNKVNEKEKEDANKANFSRTELVRVLMERNQYKEKLIELQDAVRYADSIRVSRLHSDLGRGSNKRKNTSSAVWGFFNSFLGLDKEEK